MPPVRKVKPAAKITKKEAVAVAVTPVVSGQLDKKIKKQQRKLADKRGIVFIKHLPHGFFEEQLKGYFSQFGNVTRLRLSRSKRTGGSKGFAFVEFEYPEVAQVAAETMDNYLMFKKVVKASYIPPEKQRFNYFKSSLRKVKNKAGKEIYVSSKTAATQKRVNKHNDWSDDAYQRRTAKKLNKIKSINKKYEHLGIDFSKVLIQPKRLTADEKAQKVIDDKNAAEVSGATAKKSTAIERTTATPIVADAQKQKQNKSKKQIELQDLLGNTINDDSEDEDYIALPEINMESDEEVENDDDDASISSNEETYGFAKDSDSEPADIEETPIKKKSSFGKTLKPSSKLDRFEQLIKRKPHAGAIQKVKKNVKKPVAAKAKSSMQIMAAKELVKALPLKGKQNKNLKAKTAKKQKV